MPLDAIYAPLRVAMMLLLLPMLLTLRIMILRH